MTRGNLMVRNDDLKIQLGSYTCRDCRKPRQCIRGLIFILADLDLVSRGVFVLEEGTVFW